MRNAFGGMEQDKRFHIPRRSGGFVARALTAEEKQWVQEKM